MDFKIPYVGEKLTYAYSTNYHDLLREFREEHDRDPLAREGNEIWENSLWCWKDVTVIRVSPKGYRLTVQDETGHVTDLKREGRFWMPYNGGRNEIKAGKGCYSVHLCEWLMRRPTRIATRGQDWETFGRY